MSEIITSGEMRDLWADIKNNTEQLDIDLSALRDSITASGENATTLNNLYNKIEETRVALAALIGEVQASPTANTLLARLKSLEDKIDTIDGVLNAIVDGSVPAATQLTGSRVEEVLTQADAVENILTFSDAISSIEIWHNETTRQIFVVNGITLVIGPGGWRSPVAGVKSAEVTIPAGIDCVVTRLV